MRELFGAVGQKIEVEPPFHCDYGWNIFAADGLFLNFGCVILDVTPVRIGPLPSTSAPSPEIVERIVGTARVLGRGRVARVGGMMRPPRPPMPGQERH